MWFLYRLAPGSAFYNVPIAVPFRGVIDKAAMQRTVQEFVARHEILRTTYNEPEPGSPVQVIGRMPAIEVPVSDLRGLDEQTREAEHQAAAQRLYEEPFDLERGPVLRARLIRLADRRAVLHLIVHHIAIDHWGIRSARREPRHSLRTGDAASTALPRCSICPPTGRGRRCRASGVGTFVTPSAPP